MVDRKRLVCAVLAAALAAAAPVHAQENEVSEAWAGLLAAFEAGGISRHADLRYDAIDGVDPERLSLDLYTAAGLERAPVLVFVHGGSWQRGDKRAVGRKPLRFVPAGYVVVSTNYRFRPQVEVPEMARDVAAATAWVKHHIAEYGGDPQTIFLMGHSAGAHLVALVGTKGAYLESVGLRLADLAGVIPLDTGPYNVERQLADVPPAGYGLMLRNVFGTDPAVWPAASPWHHVAPGLGIPPFLVFYHQGRGDAQRQAIPFVEQLRSSGVEAEVVEAVGKTHGSLNSDLGAAGDAPTERVLEFMADCIARRAAGASGGEDAAGEAP